MAARKVIAPEVLAEARRLYEQTAVPVRDIADMMGLSRTNLYARLPELGWKSRRDKLTFSLGRAVGEAVLLPAAEPPPHSGAVIVVMDAEAAAQQRIVVAQRLMKIVEREMDAIERIVAVLRPTDALEAEHSARTLASVSRTMRDIAQLAKPAEETPAEETPNDDAHRDPVPRDIDEFRRQLALRISALIEARVGGAGARSDGSGG